MTRENQPSRFFPAEARGFGFGFSSLSVKVDFWMDYVDLHAHFLPGLDDGASSSSDALRMVSAVASLGFTALHATPHQRFGVFLPSRENVDRVFSELRAEVKANSPSLSFGLGAENFWDEVFLTRVRDGGLPTYEGGPAFLFEVDPAMMPPRIEQTLFEIRIAGRLPVMAHPERYRAIQNDIGRAEELARSAALLVDLAALDGAHGRPAMKTARRLLEEGLVHAAATDIHTPEDQRPIAAGMAWIRKRLGPDTLERLLSENPRRILAGDLP
jgi:protein-tyrosine phosphatase